MGGAGGMGGMGGGQDQSIEDILAGSPGAGEVVDKKRKEEAKKMGPKPPPKGPGGMPDLS